MRSVKLGAILLSVWTGFNLLVAVAVTGMTLAGRPPPALALMLSAGEIAALDPRALAVVNAQAAIANPVIVALCGLVLAVVWTSLVRGARWAWRALAGTLVPLQLFGFVSDAFLGQCNLAANAISTVVLIAGLALTYVRARTPTPIALAPTY
jgi:hypothetical protein